MYIPLDVQLCLSRWAPFIIGEEMSEAQTPKHDALINNGALSSPSCGSSGGYQESAGLAASSKKVKTPITSGVVLAAAQQDTAGLVLSCLPCAPHGLGARASAQRRHLWKSERDSRLRGAPSAADQGG